MQLKFSQKIENNYYLYGKKGNFEEEEEEKEEEAYQAVRSNWNFLFIYQLR